MLAVADLMDGVQVFFLYRNQIVKHLALHSLCPSAAVAMNEHEPVVVFKVQRVVIIDNNRRFHAVLFHIYTVMYG